jgi:DNA-binding transcriptional regulator PaaX
MSRESPRSALFDGMLRVVALGAITSTALLAPNAVQIFDKPLRSLGKNLDQEARYREMRRALQYLKQNRLVTEDYEHGITLTKKARKRLQKLDFEAITLPTQTTWDGRWRIVFFDIPEERKSGRDAFAGRLRHLGFRVLQRSVFIYPHPCRQEVAAIATYLHLEKYITYVEVTHIDKDASLRKAFKLA